MTKKNYITKIVNNLETITQEVESDNLKDKQIKR